MKRICFLLLSVFALVSCTNQEDITSSEDTAAETTVRILARATSDASLTYPVHVYAFDQSGKSCAHQQITSASQTLNLGVPRNADLRIVAVSADETSYELPAAPTVQSTITLRTPETSHPLATGYSPNSPLMIGKADIHTGSAEETTLNLSLNYAVTSLTFNFYGLPAECTSVLVNVDKPYAGARFDGAQSTTTGTARILCTPNSAGCCTSGEVFLFPTAGPETVFTISYTHNGEQYSTATYAAPLRVGVPYVINGTYQDDALHLSGSITPSEWETPTVLGFTMSDGSSTDITSETSTPGDKGDKTEDETPIESNGVPQAFTIWDEHVIVAADEAPATPGTYNLLLISKKDWDAVPSAFNESGGYSAADYAEVYSENGLSGWTIPTEDQARLLYDQYSQHTDAFAAVLQNIGADPVMPVDDSGKNVRYLCANAEKTYSYKTSSILTAGKTVKDYHLRLVRKVTVSTR